MKMGIGILTSTPNISIATNPPVDPTIIVRRTPARLARHRTRTVVVGSDLTGSIEQPTRSGAKENPLLYVDVVRCLNMPCEDEANHRHGIVRCSQLARGNSSRKAPPPTSTKDAIFHTK